MPFLKDPTIAAVSCQTVQKQFPLKTYDNLPLGQLTALRNSVTLQAFSSTLRRSVAQAKDSLYNLRWGPTKEEKDALKWLEQRKSSLERSLPKAFTSFEWLEIAAELDELDKHNEWKANPESDDYDWVTVQRSLKELERARNSDDIGEILHIMRTGINRHLGGITNPNLYNKSRLGTKNLVDRYTTTATEVVSVLLDLAEKSTYNVEESQYILEQLVVARQCFGRTALLLSGGATFGMNHIGVVKTLWQTRLLPQIISGSSAGSIVGAVLCASTDAEIPGILASLGEGGLSVFEPNDAIENVLNRLKKLLTQGSLFDIAHLTALMRDLLGDITFQEAYNRTRRILNIGVSGIDAHELPRILNYVTAPDVPLWSAVAASCSVPLVFAPATLMVKDPLTGVLLEWNESHLRWIDGSVDNDLPMSRVSEIFNVNHFIVSQVNPHITPFMPPEEVFVFRGIRERELTPDSGWFQSLRGYAKQEIMCQIDMLSGAGLLPNTLKKLASIANQSYYGDINILPEITYEVLPTILRNPTADFMFQSCLSGERATWPMLGRIRNHCSFELALDAAVQIMRERVSVAEINAEQSMSAMLRKVNDASSTKKSKTPRTLRRKTHDSEIPKLKHAREHTTHRPIHHIRRSRSFHIHEDHSISPEFHAELSHHLARRKLARSALKVAKTRHMGHINSHNLGGNGWEELCDHESTGNASLSTSRRSSLASSYLYISRSGHGSPVIQSRRTSADYGRASTDYHQTNMESVPPNGYQDMARPAPTLPVLTMTALSQPTSPEQEYVKVCRRTRGRSN